MSLPPEIYLMHFGLRYLKKKKQRQLLGFPVTINEVPKATKVQLKLNLFAAHMLKNKGQKKTRAAKRI